MNRERAGTAGQAGRRLRSHILAALLPLSFLAFGYVTGCGEYKPVLQDLEGVDALKTQFNKDRGRPRVVLLLSPT
jgi:hypothetical protein